ncbi:hypothetical protein LCGC14_0370980 [marine sediment metagenome]|uniref:Uncharacterized protein n=1 Tax=marine sediment metagenome TaxID=412755 RepID=A0A0F9TNA4_9ZZZZ|nr:hypothetical protein [Maribacter sp.]HDZ04857.1 hypothetical protein [Maribacter sp.]
MRTEEEIRAEIRVLEQRAAKYRLKAETEPRRELRDNAKVMSDLYLAERNTLKWVLNEKDN